jgi:SAM-dependent methyltransferase
MNHPMTEVPTGNAYDKYGTTNPIEKALMGRFFETLDELVGDRAPSRLLEVGMGEGHVSGRLLERFPATGQVGVDLPDHGLVESWRAVGVTGAFADITRLPFPDDTFDLVLAIEVLEHVADPERALSELGRVGSDRLVLSVPREPLWRVLNMTRLKYLRRLGNTPGHVQHWSAHGFAELVDRHADIVERRSPLPWTAVAATVAPTR